MERFKRIAQHASVEGQCKNNASEINKSSASEQHTPVADLIPRRAESLPRPYKRAALFRPISTSYLFDAGGSPKYLGPWISIFLSAIFFFFFFFLKCIISTRACESFRSCCTNILSEYTPRNTFLEIY